jgi:pimeloyl-ACP methyl ester carboxylesterase
MSVEMTLVLHRRGNGRPFVFQHGLCGDASQTFEAAPQLLNWELLTLECRGHGKSCATPPFSIPQFADDVVEIIEYLGEPVVLGGISMGAAIATRIAVQRPKLICGLVLVRPAWLTENAPDNMQPNAEVGRMIAAGQTGVDFEASAMGRRLALEAPDNLTSLLGFFDRCPHDVTAALLTQISADGPGISVGDLAELRCPALICGTAQDVVHPLALAQHLAQLIPSAGYVELPPKGADKPAHIAALHTAIATFLQEI